MAERKVLTKYYPPDFDPSKITRTRGPKNAGPKVMTVRLMAPFGMKCISCGEYIYKGRKFNARKETTDEKYLQIPIYRFYIRCTRCSAEITFKTDPKNMNYTCERGAKRNFEVWRNNDPDANKLETEDEMLDRLEAEAAEKGGVMAELETKVLDAKREMEIADALDEIRTRNARIQRAEGREAEGELDVQKEREKQEEDRREMERRKIEREDDEAAKRAFGLWSGEGLELGEEAVVGEKDEVMHEAGTDSANAAAPAKGPMVGDMPPPTFKRAPKKKKDFSAALGIKKKPALV